MTSTEREIRLPDQQQFTIVNNGTVGLNTSDIYNTYMLVVYYYTRIGLAIHMDTPTPIRYVRLNKQKKKCTIM